ncbi:hypothetical protein KQX54_009254 [Cotesia glomerata]|uniref:Uncharacterized protein n=1 Tax=Cotesia glomerata TaxID=32391 RepID=A0AAV7HUL8_COTGL|nr:hypothetical protein KQX54_009254 [Cotesia glomerata]
MSNSTKIMVLHFPKEQLRRYVRSNISQSSNLEMEESLEEEPQSINAEEIHEDITDEIEDYFTDSSEEFNDAEQIESATHGIGMDSDSDEENNSNDSSDSDSEDTNSLSKAF